MIIGEALRAWAADSEAEAKTTTRIRALAKALRELPAFERLERALAANQGLEADAVLALARPLIDEEAASGPCARTLAQAALADAFLRPPLRVAKSEVHQGLLLFDAPALSIQLGWTSAEAVAAKRAGRIGGASISFSGQRSLYRFLEAGGATFSFWEAPLVEPGFSARSSGRCRLVERRRIEDGESFELDGRRHAFIVDHCPRNLVYLHATTPIGSAPLTIEYDSGTLAFVGASSGDEATSRTLMMLALLRVMDRQDAAPLFAEMVRGEHFYARWQAMREYLALDAEAALPALRRMAAGDPHSEVREAARRTLDLFFDEEIVPAEGRPEPCLA